MDRPPASFADFMRNNDPEISRGVAKPNGLIDDGDSDGADDDNDDDGGLIGPSCVSEAQQQQEQHRLGISGVATAALFPSNVASHSTEDSNVVNPSSHIEYFRRHQQEPKRKNPPSYHHHDARANLKNDLSYSYQQSNDQDGRRFQSTFGGNTNRQMHVQQHQYQQQEVENPSPYQRYAFAPNGNNGAQNNYLLYANNSDHPTQSPADDTVGLDAFGRKPSGSLSVNEIFERKPLSASNPMKYSSSISSSSSSNKHVSSSSDPSNKRPDPRPRPRPGKPPPPNAKAIEPKLFASRLGRRGLSLLARLPSPSTRHKQPTAGSTLDHHRNSHGSAMLGATTKTIRVECVGCKYILDGIPKNAVALECPRCREFHPTVTCRVIQ